MFDLIIIGGGASGMTAGAMASGMKAIILESTERPMKKLLISGSGKCNFTHGGDVSDLISRYGGKDVFVKKAIRHFDNRKAVEFMGSLGVYSEEREDGKVFPRSEKAQSIEKALRDRCGENGVKILTGKKAVSICRDASTGQFTVKTATGEEFRGSCVLMCTGGRSFPSTGSDGSGYYLASSLGHTLVPPRPSLAPVYLDLGGESHFRSIQGTAFEDIEIELVKADKSLQKKSFQSLRGKMVVTHKGLSGPVILDNSRYFDKGDRLKVNFSKDLLTVKEAESELLKLADRSGKTKLSTFLRNHAATKNVGDYLFGSLGLAGDVEMALLTKELRKRVSSFLVRKEFVIREVADMSIAMATSGGVDLSTVKASTMESKEAPGLFFAGEVLDVDGDTGGYNIQWAMSSASLAMKGIRELLKG